MKVYPRSETHPALRNTFIYEGYRKSFCTFKECLQYMFVLHNEWGDFWSHFLSLVGWIFVFFYLYASGVVTLDPFFYPLVCYFIGCCICMAGSCIAHAFSPISVNAHTVCFLFDYLGISSYAFGADLALYYYERPLNHWYFEHKWVNLGIFTMLTVLSTAVSCFTRFFCKKYRYSIRAIVYSLPAVVGTLPLIVRLLSCEGSECIPQTYPYHIICYMASFGSFFFFASKLPERVSPRGKFNYFGHSHQLFHICVTISITAQIATLTMDSLERKSLLTDLSQKVTFDFVSTFGPLLAVNVLNLACVVLFSVMTVKGYLVDEKVLYSKKES